VFTEADGRFGPTMIEAVFLIVPGVRGAVTRICKTVGVPTGIVKLKQRRTPGKGTQFVLLTKRKRTPAGS
jgi:hypothetical protein